MGLNMINDEDKELIKAAQKAIQKNYDAKHFLHTVGAAVRCKSGNIYVGVNVYSMHGACAEQVALGCAMTQGEREFETMVAVRGEKGEEIIPPCGNCRQMMIDYMPNCEVILMNNEGVQKVGVKELLPFAYILKEN